MKKYAFWKSTDGSKEPVRYEVGEKDLTQQQKDLMLGTALNEYRNLPKELKDIFISKVFLDVMIEAENEINNS
jgi:hypothetical protein